MPQLNAELNSKTIAQIDDLSIATFKKLINYDTKDMAALKMLFMPATENWNQDEKKIVELDTTGFAGQKGQNEEAKVNGASQGYTKIFKRKTVSGQRILSGEAKNAFTKQGIIKMATNVTADLKNKIRLDMAHFLTFSNATSYVDMDGNLVNTTVGDGKALISNAHTLTESNQTYSNRISGDPSLSENSLFSAENIFAYNIVDNQNLPLEAEVDTLITSRDGVMMGRAARILKSISPERIEGGVNSNAGVMNTFMNANIKHLAIRFDINVKGQSDTTKSKNWFVAALRGTQNRLGAYFVKWDAPEADVLETDYNKPKFQYSFIARGFYAIGATCGRYIAASYSTS